MVPAHSNEYRSIFYCRESSTPSVLHTSSESRKEAKIWYKLRKVEYEKYGPAVYPSTEQQLYFNFSIDILYPIFHTTDRIGTDPIIEENWAEIITKHRTLRQFRRVAIIKEDETWYQKRWDYIARDLQNSRSKIEEILAVYSEGPPPKAGRITGHSFRTDRHLERLADGYIIYDYHWEAYYPYAESVASLTAGIFKCLDSEETSDNDGVIQEDPPSDTESEESSPTLQKDAPSGSMESADVSHPEVAKNTREKKPWPKIKFVTFENRFKPRARVYVPESL